MSKTTLNNPSSELIVKANKLIEARYKFTLWEMRVFAKMVSLIKPQDKHFQLCRLYIKDLMKFYNSSSKEDYRTIRGIPPSLASKAIGIPYLDNGSKRYRLYPLFLEVSGPADKENSESNSYIELRFNDVLEDMLIALKKEFKKYSIWNIVPLRSTYSIRIFELLKQYESTKQKRRDFNLTDLKEILDILETDEEFENRINKLRGEAKTQAIKEGKIEVYPLYADFKKRVLLKARADLKKHCDIYFNLHEIKEGRRVVRIGFEIIRNDAITRKSNSLNYDTSVTDDILETIETSQPSENYEQLYSKIKQWFTEEAFKNLLSKYPESQVREAIDITLQRLRKGDNVNNVVGHIVSLSKQTSLFNPEKEKAASVIQKKKFNGNIDNKQQTDLVELLNQQNKEEARIIAKLLKSNPELRSQYIEKIKADKFVFYNESETEDENLERPFTKAAFNNAIIKDHPLEFKPIQEKFEQKIKLLTVDSALIGQ